MRANYKHLLHFCEHHNIFICSNEIHADIVYTGHRHTSLVTIERAAPRSIVCMSPSKTFNLGGMKMSYTIIPNADIRRRVDAVHNALFGHDPITNVGLACFAAAYTHGEQWYKEMLKYIEANKDHVLQYIQKCIPQMRPIVPQATHMVWIDCSEMMQIVAKYTEDNGLDLKSSESSLISFLVKEAGIMPSQGSVFGSSAHMFIRINFACPRSIITNSLVRIRRAIDRVANS